MITIIAAVARNRAIGFENKFIYWLPNDLKRFKQLTTGHTIIMGRNTFLSLSKGALPNRQAMKLADRLCLTEVDDTPAKADTFFPDYSDWHEQWREDHDADERHAHAYSFVDYVR